MPSAQTLHHRECFRCLICCSDGCPALSVRQQCEAQHPCSAQVSLHDNGTQLATGSNFKHGSVMVSTERTCRVGNVKRCKLLHLSVFLCFRPRKSPPFLIKTPIFKLYGCAGRGLCCLEKEREEDRI